MMMPTLTSRRSLVRVCASLLALASLACFEKKSNPELAQLRDARRSQLERIRSLTAQNEEQARIIGEQAETLSSYIALVEETFATLAEISKQERELVRATSQLEYGGTIWVEETSREAIRRQLDRVAESIRSARENEARLRTLGREIEGLRRELDERERVILELRARVESLEAVRQGLEETTERLSQELDRVSGERDQLAAEQERLRGHVMAAEVVVANSRALRELVAGKVLERRGVLRAPVYFPGPSYRPGRMPGPAFFQVDRSERRIALGRSRATPTIVSVHASLADSYRVQRDGVGWVLLVVDPGRFWSAGGLVVAEMDR